MTDKMPDVTNKMKAENHGHHTFLTTAECGECLDVGPDQECEICGGDIVYQKQVGVPWDICKQIFKSMYLSSDIEQKHAEEISALEAKHSEDLNKIIELIKQRISDE